MNPPIPAELEQQLARKVCAVLKETVTIDENHEWDLIVGGLNQLRAVLLPDLTAALVAVAVKDAALEACKVGLCAGGVKNPRELEVMQDAFNQAKKALALTPQSAANLIAEQAKEIERERERANQHMKWQDEHYTEHQADLAAKDATIAELRQEVERLTKSRNEADANGQERVMSIWLQCLGDQVYPKSHHIDALGKTTRKLTDDRNAAQKELKQVAMQLRDATAQLAQLEADKGRLDWLEQEHCGVEAFTMDDPFGEPTRKLFQVDGEPINHALSNIRQAIDRAIDAARTAANEKTEGGTEG